MYLFVYDTDTPVESISEHHIASLSENLEDGWTEALENTGDTNIDMFTIFEIPIITKIEVELKIVSKAIPTKRKGK
jgi:hypothetical protein